MAPFLDAKAAVSDMSLNHLLLYCRPGFESDCANEIQSVSARLGIFGYVKTRENAGYVTFISHEPDGALQIQKKQRFSGLVFARQWVAAGEMIADLPMTDRVGALTAALADFPQCGEVRLETADTNDAKELSVFCRKFAHPLRQGLRKAGLLTKTEDSRKPCLHLFFIDSCNLYAGISRPGNNSPWPMGIPRLKFPKEAPSRSTLKLEEAFHVFVPRDEWDTRLAPGMKAVDLGAAPGGWTWQLVNRHMFVTAVDNGPMHRDLMESGLVNHLQEDGFMFQPAKPVDWMVCDIVDKPSRTAGRMADWLVNGWCREAIFNLKLPMKQRFSAVEAAVDKIQSRMVEAERRCSLNIKQLYHDREEVTVHAKLEP